MFSRLNGKGSGVGSLKGRSLKFLIIIILSSLVSLFFSLVAQNKILNLSNSMHTQILPTINLLENIRLELDLQIREIQLVSALAEKQSPKRAPRLALIRLGPASRNLSLNERQSKLSPIVEKELIEWAEQARLYSEKLASFNTELSALYDLKRLRDRIDLSHRKLKSNFSIQLLELSQNTSRSFIIWICTFALGLLTSLALLFLLWKWLTPLKHLEEWFRSKDFGKWAPPSARGTGLLSPPLEIQNLVDAVRENIQSFQTFSEQVEERVSKAQETEKSAGTLITLLYHLSKRNEELLNKLIEREKLASMGEMAAQLAHEIRNPLNSMSLKLEFLLEDANPELAKAIEAILKEIDRLDALTESHLRSTKAKMSSDTLPSSEEKPKSLEAPPEEEQHCMRSKELYDNIRNLFNIDLESRNVILSFRGDDFEVPLPSSVSKAVLINLVKNALDSMEDMSARREIVFEARKNQKLWRLLIKDTGPGFTDDYLARPFKVFQTTKEGGTGLGLPTSKKMLEAYGAELKILSASADFGARVEISKELDPPQTSLHKDTL
ncbi:HAMP domain-containing histidine kinase [bacterium]|nr:HAMP domain-containing histidine kinase [bacterium]